MLGMLDWASSFIRTCYSGLLIASDHQHITKSPRLPWLSIQEPITQVAKACKRSRTTPNSTTNTGISHISPPLLFSLLFHPPPFSSAKLSRQKKFVFLSVAVVKFSQAPAALASVYARARFWALSPLAQIRPFHLN